MKIPIDDLTQQPLHIRRALPAGYYGEELVLLGPAGIDVEIVKSGEKVEVSGSVSARAELVCSRCLEKFQFAIEARHDLCYLPSHECGEEENARLNRDELSVIYYTEPVINLYEDIRQTMHLVIPFKPVCSKDCRGLCPSCGADLNETACGCGSSEENLQFAKLKQLRKELENGES